MSSHTGCSNTEASMIWLRTLLVALVCGSVATAGDWPQWLGASRNGTTAEAVKPWTEKPTVVWRASIGEGHSSPVVVGDKVYLHYRVPGKDEERVTAFDAANGKGVASVTHARKTFKGAFGAGPRATPTATPDGQVVT